jgi:ribosomal protein L11 methyltransferase
MKNVSPAVCQYSLIEIALAGEGLRAKEKEAARALLLHCRIPEKSLVTSDYKGAFSLACYTRSAKKVREVRRRYRAAGKPAFALKIKTLRKRDWFDKWKRDYHMKPLGARFMIVPAWERTQFKPQRRIPIFLEPGSAFGSGYHETTRLMARLLESLAGKIGSFLDIGCGTGILSVAAAKLGAEKIAGFDNDRPSSLVSVKNFQSNGCTGGAFFCAQLKSLKVAERFDAVGANLLSKTLLELRREIILRVRPGGFLLVSGIALQNFPAFKRGFSGPGLKCQKILRGHRWAAVLYRKKNPFKARLFRLASGEDGSVLRFIPKAEK